jgi:putative heme transporter
VACLLAAIHAVGVSVPARDLATAYLAIQLIRQIPVTPGGVGVVEASLVVALTATGAAPAPAAAAVILYRLLSCWGLLPVGLLCWITQRLAERANRSGRPDLAGISDVGP